MNKSDNKYFSIKKYRSCVIVLYAMAMMFIASACGSSNKTPDATTSTNSQSEHEQNEAHDDVRVSEPEENKEPVELPEEKLDELTELSEDELDEFTNLFNSEEYNGFLKESYSSPEQINWDSVLEFGAGILAQNVSEDEISDYLEYTGEKELYGELFTIRKSDFDEYVSKHTGLNSVAADALSWDYVEEHESYYKIYWTSHQNQYTCVSGEKVGDNYELRFRVNSDDLQGPNTGKNYGRWADRILKLTKNADGIIIESNDIQWDDYCDEEQTFDVKLSQFESPVHFVTYSANPDKAEIVVVKDGNYLSDLYTSVYSEGGNAYLKKIIAVGFFDFNSDGMDDIAVIGDSDFGKYTLLYEALLGDYSFETFAELNEKKMAEIGSDFTIEGIKSALLGENQGESYGSYRELYAHLAQIYSIEDEKNQFNLIYADDDDIPEFVVGNTGYWVSLIAFEDGKAHYLMNRWAYGAGGNGGYSYAPGKGIYYNGNADYAGAVYYNTYMSKRDVGELGTDYWVKEINFNDLDGDGWPSEGELEDYDESVGSSEYHCEIDKGMTEDEIKAVVSLYDSYETKEVVGKMDYPTFLDKLDGKEVGITADQALAAIRKYCIDKNPDLEEMANSDDYTIYWNVESIDDTDIVVLYRAYTGAQLRYYIDRFSGSTYSMEFVPGITEEGQWTDEYFDVNDYIE